MGYIWEFKYCVDSSHSIFLFTLLRLQLWWPQSIPHLWILNFSFFPNQTPNSQPRIKWVRKQLPHPISKLKEMEVYGPFLLLLKQKFRRVRRMRGRSAPPPTRPPPAAIVWRCCLRYLSQVLARGSGVGAPPPLWVPSGSPVMGRGKLGALAPAPAPAPHPRLISLPEMCIWLDTPGDLPWPPRVRG